MLLLCGVRDKGCLYQFSLALKFPGDNAKDPVNTGHRHTLRSLSSCTALAWQSSGLVPLKQSFFAINAVPLPFRLVYTHPPWEMPFWNVVVFALLICPEAVCTDTQGLLSAASLRLRFENLKRNCSKSCYILRINMTPPMRNRSFTFIWYSQNPATCMFHMKLFSPHVYKKYTKYKGISCLIFESHPETVHYVCVKNMKSWKMIPSISDGKYLPCPSVW